MRTFDTGATRDVADGKPEYDQYLSVPALRAFGRYMLACADTPDGPRPGDNWQKGIPLDAYMSSMFRHFFDVWALHRGFLGTSTDSMEEALCALLFNVQGYLHEVADDG